MSDAFFLRLRRSDADPELDDPAGVPERGHMVLLWFLVAGLAILVLGAALLDSNRWPSLAASAFLLGAASLLAGGLVGLLFGVPRVIGVVTDEQEPSAPRDAGRRTGYVANTNLERVSDWLSAIIVGVTLTQLGEIPGLFQRLVDYVAGPFGDSVTPTMVAGTVVLFSIGGFIFGYLWSRLTLGPAFLSADRRSIDEIVAEAVETKIGEQTAPIETKVNEGLQRVQAKVQGLERGETALEKRLERVEGKVDDGLRGIDDLRAGFDQLVQGMRNPATVHAPGPAAGQGRSAGLPADAGAIPDAGQPSAGPRSSDVAPALEEGESPDDTPPSGSRRPKK